MTKHRNNKTVKDKQIAGAMPVGEAFSLAELAYFLEAAGVEINTRTLSNRLAGYQMQPLNPYPESDEVKLLSRVKFSPATYTINAEQYNGIVAFGKMKRGQSVVSKVSKLSRENTKRLVDDYKWPKIKWGQLMSGRPGETVMMIGCAD